MSSTRRAKLCGEAHCSAHGLRKAAATIAANNGATVHQFMAIFGWDTFKEAEKYTAKADQQR
ncbi:MAG: tyrosine-type recombinase/integrase [Xanthobacteraceae bacterium]